MRRSDLNLSFLSWIVAIFLVLMGLSIYSEGKLASFICILLGAFFTPPVFDFIDFNFATKRLERRLYKIVIFFAGVFLLGTTGGLADSKYEKEVDAIKLSYSELSKESDLQSNLDQIESQITSLPERYKVEFDTIIEDIQVFRAYYSGADKFVSSGVGASKLSPEELDSFYNGAYLRFASNETINQTILEELNTSIPTKEDFPDEVQYYYFRLKHSIENKDNDRSSQYFIKILDLNKRFEFSDDDIIYILDNLTSIDIDEVVMYNYIRKYKSDHLEILLKLANNLFKAEQNMRAYELIRMALKIEKDNPDAVRLAGNIAYSREQKRTAIQHFEHLNELKQLDKQSCNILRELTRYIASWHYYSICCDGSRSEATGRGACSHHSGVCKSMKEPIYSYKYDYCR